MAAKGGKLFLLKIGNGIFGAVTFQNTGDTVTKNGHGLQDGDIVVFDDINTPNGLTEGTEYYVISSMTNTFQVALTAGGSAVAISADSTGTLLETFNSVCGSQSLTLSASSEGIEVTNVCSDEWKTLLDGAGIKSFSASGSGIFEPGRYLDQFRADFFANTIRNFKIVEDLSTTDEENVGYYEGAFKITGFERAGEYNGAQTFSVSLESSGEVTYTKFNP